MKLKKLALYLSLFFACSLLSGPGPISAQTIALTQPNSGTTFISGEPVVLTAEIANPAYLHITNSQTGFRKLKIGYSPVNLYAPMNNVIAGGNNTLEITICNYGTVVDWKKIQVRPQGNTAAPVSLATYVNVAGGIGTGWKTISIPLSAFDPSVNFTQLSLIELPYSASAGSFDLGISKIAFTGGSAPFVWFGSEHTNNIQNGNGGSGEVVAQLVTPAQGSIAVERVDFYSGTDLIGSSATLPYQFSWVTSAVGSFSLTAVARYVDGSSIKSAPVVVTVKLQPVSQLSVQMVTPLQGENYNYPSDISVAAVISGFSIPDPAWMHVTNTLTGYRKLKIGYNPVSLYAPVQNVIAGGNTAMEITIKDLSGKTDWSKIQVRPQGSTAAPVSLAPYVTAAGGVSTEWKTISIPLSAFDASINFTQLTLIELPYSLSAGNLDLGIQRIQFTGGSTPFVWFGGSKTDNSHNGNGGAGELVAKVIASAPGGPRVSRVDFYTDNTLAFTDVTDPFDFIWTGATVGAHTIMTKMTDDQGFQKQSDPVNILVNEAKPNTITLTVTFDTPPSQLSVEKSVLRYNKAFAYSFTLDDGLIDAYTVAFPLLKGGLVTGNNTVYPGYFYSDGCGNAIPFSAGLSWFSVNNSGTDLHVNTPGNISWTQLKTMHDAGWNVFNHSYSHAAYGTTDYQYQITANRDNVKAKTGIDLTHFVIPSGDAGYVVPAFENGMLTVSNNNSAYLGSPNGYRIDQSIDFGNMKLFRMLLSDANQNTANVMQKIDYAAAQSVNGQHYWWSDFTHHVGFQSSGASMLFPLFQYYMETIATQYGISGADNVWMAPTQDVYEYLKVRDNSLVSYSISGNVMTITIDYSAVPAGLQTYALTLGLQSDQDFGNVVVSGAKSYSFKGTGNNKLINLQWTPTSLKASNIAPKKIQPESEIQDPAQVSFWPNPFTDRLTVRFSQPVQGETRFILLDMTGKTLFHANLYAPEGESRFELDLRNAGLLPGMYILRSENAGIKLPLIKVIRN